MSSTRHNISKLMILIKTIIIIFSKKKNKIKTIILVLYFIWFWRLALKRRRNVETIMFQFLLAWKTSFFFFPLLSMDFLNNLIIIFYLITLTKTIFSKNIFIYIDFSINVNIKLCLYTMIFIYLLKLDNKFKFNITFSCILNI